MKITVAVITPQDYEKFNAVGMNAEACLADRVKLIYQDDAGSFPEYKYTVCHRHDDISRGESGGGGNRDHGSS